LFKVVFGWVGGAAVLWRLLSRDFKYLAENYPSGKNERSEVKARVTVVPAALEIFKYFTRVAENCLG
jgi:hypothetical protein